MPLPPDTPVAKALAIGCPIAVLEDNLSPNGIAQVFHGPVQTLEVRAGEDLPTFFARLEAAGEDGRWTVLAADYELGYALEPKLRALMPPSNEPLARAWIWPYRSQLSRVEADVLFDTVLERLDEDARRAGVGALSTSLDITAHHALVKQILDWINAGDCYQINLTFPQQARIWGDPFSLYLRLRAMQPVRHGGFVRHSSGTILCRSPELFVAREGRRLTVRPMKGTAPCGEAARLANSVKDRAENLMIVDLLRNDLGRLAPAGGVHVERLFEIEDYPTLHQMTSTLMAEPVDADLFTLFQALFPCGSVTGAPKIIAMERIRQLEAAPRGLYCGALGWIAPDGDFSFCVPIRTAFVSHSGMLRLNVGSGIVADSDPATEYAECLTKARFLTDIEPGFSLIETLCCDGGQQPYPLLERHLTRLSRSAQALGFAVDIAEIRRALVDHASDCGGPRRVRLQLEPDGRYAITSAALDPLPELVTVVLATERLISSSPLLAHKTTARSRYDAAMKEAIAQGHFDALFFNERDELCEGARSNVFVEIDGRLFTPPTECGLLPGVMRETLLAAGRARERVIERGELLAAQRIYVTNALRGLVPVQLAP